MALHSEPTAESMSHTDRGPRLVDSRCRGLRVDGDLIADDLGRHRVVLLVHSVRSGRRSTADDNRVAAQDTEEFIEVTQGAGRGRET